ncbi:hypothetical protein A4A49_28310 [Nicotiana attenuata]|uniref:Uncharacterized protein n=1 Tax=Nicotiana attenuata TaxID=49451 RepID=A0A314KWM0_NICAT|nr:hypothetical protein A4A49_28310 [Nicotiana attenuata]
MEVLDRFSSSDNPESWHFRAERYFNYLGFAKTYWLPLPSFYLDGEALNWFNCLFRNKQFFDWTHFKAKFAHHFRQQTAIYSVRRFVGSSYVSFDYIDTVPTVSQSTMVSPFPVSSLFPKTSAFETAYETENSKADHMFHKLPVTYKNLDSLTLIAGSGTEIVNLEDIEALQIWNANSVEVVELVQEPCAITEDHGLDDISFVVVSSDIHDLNALVPEGNNSVTTVSTVCSDSCYANASFPTKVHTEALDDTTRSDDGEKENSRDSTMTGVFGKFPQWDTLDFLVFTSQGIVVSNASVRFDVIDFPFDGTIWFGTIPWLSSYREEIGGANQNQMSLFDLHKCNWVDTGQVCNFFGFLLSKSRECAREQKIQRGLQVFKVALGRVDMSVADNGNSIKSCAMYTLLGESLENSFMCSVADATTPIEEQYIIDQLSSFLSGRTLQLSVLHHALTFIMVTLFNTENAHKDALLKIVGALAETSVHYTAPADVVSVIPLALTCGERDIIFLELKKSIPNNLVEVSRTKIMEFREVLAGVNAEQYVLESHGSGSFTVTRGGFCDDLGKGTKTTVIKSTVEHQDGVATFVDIFVNYDAFMVAQLHVHKGTNCIFSETYKRMLDLDSATVKLTFSLSKVNLQYILQGSTSHLF